MENIINNTVICNTDNTEKATVWDILRTIRYFAPLTASLGFLLGFTLGNIKIIEIFSLVLIAIGLIAAFTVCPLKLISFPIKCAAKGFTICRGFIPFYGVADLVAATVGVALGVMFGLAVIAFAPAFFTIKKFLTQAEED